MDSSNKVFDKYRNADGTLSMTEGLVSEICKLKGFYRLPELNEKLYLHYFGFSKIENLEEFINCKAIWLENNTISAIENLSPLTQLSTIFIQNNFIQALVPSSSSSADTTSCAVVDSLGDVLKAVDEENKTADTSSRHHHRHVDPNTTIPTTDNKHVDDADESSAVQNESWAITQQSPPLVSPSGRRLPSSTTAAALPSVINLDISNNLLTSLAGISVVFPNLEKLIAAHNKITDLRGEELAAMAHLNTVDLSHNLLAIATDENEGIRNDGDGLTKSGGDERFAVINEGNPYREYLPFATSDEGQFIGCLSKMPALSSLMINGNQLVRKIKNYRNKMICNISALKYLDEYPVFGDERERAAAYGKGGITAERETKRNLKEAEQSLKVQNMERFDKMICASSVLELEEDNDDDLYIPK